MWGDIHVQMPSIQLQVGDRVDLPRSGWYNCGVVRYRGPLKGVPGVTHNKVFLGIELDDAIGKNDGSVNGHRLFQCADQHGVFCRPQIVRRSDYDSATNGENLETNRASALTQSSSSSALPSNSSQPKKLRRLVEYDSNGRPKKPHPPSCSNSDANPLEDELSTSGKKNVDSAQKTFSGQVRPSEGKNKKVKNRSGDNNRNKYCDKNSGKKVHRGRRNFDPSLCRIPGIKGLKNLGNTCFVNSVLQNISNLPPVRDYFLSGLTVANSPSSKATFQNGSVLISRKGIGPLTTEMADFIRKMWLQEEQPVLNPKSLFGELCSRVPRFGHRQQQDAVEALRYLLDGLDNEALKVEAAEAEIAPKKKMVSNDVRCEFQSESSSPTSSAPQVIESAPRLIDTLEGSMNNLTIDVPKDMQSTVQKPPPLPPPTPQSSRHFSPGSALDLQSRTGEIECDENISDENITASSQEKPTAASPQPCGPKIAKHGLVADVFSGVLCSEISCDNCGAISRVKERFSDVSLPIPANLIRSKPKASAPKVTQSHMQESRAPNLENVKNTHDMHSSKSREVLDMAIAKELDEAAKEARLAIAEEAEASLQKKATRSGIEKCLSHFFEAEVLEGRDCDECKERCGAKRRYVFQDPLPDVLTLHIKRFAQTMTGRLKKLNTYVSYPIELDLGKFCPEEEASIPEDEQDCESRSLGSSPIMQGSIRTRSGNGRTSSHTDSYVLCGVVVHGGTLHGGHYSAFIRRPKKYSNPADVTLSDSPEQDSINKTRDSEWIYISDARVRIATAEEALQRHGAYILFYCRKDYASNGPLKIPKKIFDRFDDKSNCDAHGENNSRGVSPAVPLPGTRTPLQPRRDVTTTHTFQKSESRKKIRESHHKRTPMNSRQVHSVENSECNVHFPPVVDLSNHVSPSSNPDQGAGGTQVVPPTAIPRTGLQRPHNYASVQSKQQSIQQIQGGIYEQQAPATAQNQPPNYESSNLPNLGTTQGGHRSANSDHNTRVNKILRRREQRIQNRQEKSLIPLQPSTQDNMVGETPTGDPKKWLKLLKKKRVR